MMGRVGTRLEPQKAPDETAWNLFVTHNEYLSARKKNTSKKAKDGANESDV